VCNLCSQPYADWEVSFENWGLLDSVLRPLNLCVDCYRTSLPPEHVDNDAIVIREKRPRPMPPECLYILMGYAGTDLTAEMGRMAASESEAAGAGGDDAAALARRRWDIFGQCVQGLHAIHAAGITHRDIKGGNIFVDEADDGSLIATIGDLGLASVASASASASAGPGTSTCNSGGETEHPQGSGRASSDVGTLLYCAPEVATGRYDEKCDIYSLGIVLIELFAGFRTGMERIQVLTRVRQNEEILDDDLLGLDATVRELARRMCSHHVDARPSCQDILEYLLKNDLPVRPDAGVLLSLVKDLQGTVSEQEGEIRRLKALLDANGIHVF
jgi:serine/threonine protein kinase